MNPTANPTGYPTANTTAQPTMPTMDPTAIPTAIPSVIPTVNPTVIPTTNPTMNPSSNPTAIPTVFPTKNPTTIPTAIPINNTSMNPTVNPTVDPTVNPTGNPTFYPVINPTKNPTIIPTGNPSKSPSVNPTVNPTPITNGPTAYPTLETVITQNYSLVMDADYNALNQMANSNRTRIYRIARRIVRRGLGLDDDASLSANIEITVLDVRSGSVIIDYVLVSYNADLVESAMSNMNASVSSGEPFSIQNITFEFSSNEVIPDSVANDGADANADDSSSESNVASLFGADWKITTIILVSLAAFILLIVVYVLRKRGHCDEQNCPTKDRGKGLEKELSDVISGSTPPEPVYKPDTDLQSDGEGTNVYGDTCTSPVSPVPVLYGNLCSASQVSECEGGTLDSPNNDAGGNTNGHSNSSSHSVTMSIGSMELDQNTLYALTEGFND